MSSERGEDSGKQFLWMRRLVMRANHLKALSILALGAIGMLALGRRAAAEPGDRQAELVGTWQVQVSLVDCQTGTPLSPTPFSSLLTFASGGTMAEDTTNPAFGPGQRGGGQGAWSYQGDRTYRARDVAFIKYTTPPNPAAHNPGFEGGQQSITQTITFTSSDQWNSVAAITFADSTGAVYRQGCAVASAQRF
jgi:hypothetical protein